MNVWKFIKTTVLNACFYFTVAEFAILISAALIAELSPEIGGNVVRFLNLSSTALVFLACLILSSLSFIWKLSYSAPIKTVIHYLSTLAAFVIMFIVIPRVFGNVTLVISLVALYTGAYVLIGLIVLLVNSIIKKRRSDSIEYKEQFSELTKK